jgi:thioredoxin-related protein
VLKIIALFNIDKVGEHMKKIQWMLVLAIMSITVGQAQDWHTNFSKAKAQAKNEDKPIVLVFQGSDWCAPCIKLNKDVWSTDVFKAYAAEHYIMLQADFPRKKANSLSPEQTAANAKLAEAYNPRGIFPLVVLMDENGKVLGETSYKKLSPQEYIQELNDFLK